MTTSFNSHRPKAWIAQEPESEPIEEIVDKETKVVKTRKLASQRNVVHEKTYYTTIHQNNTTALPTTSESEPQIFRIMPSDVQGRINTIKLKQVITVSASSVCYPQNMIDHLYYNLGTVQTPAMDGRLIAAESMLHVNEEDLAISCASLGYSTAWAGITANTEITILIDVTSPIRAMQLRPSLLKHPIEIIFNYRKISEWMDVATQTVTALTSTMIVESTLTDDKEDAILANAYREGLQISQLVPYPVIQKTLAGTTELDVNLDFSGTFAFIVGMISDVSADVQENALDFSALTKYRIHDASGNTIWNKNGASYVTVNEHWARDSDIQDGTGWYTHNILMLNCGCTNPVETLRDGTYRGGYKFENSEHLEITSSDTSADVLYLFPYKYETFLIKDGDFVNRSSLD